MPLLRSVLCDAWRALPQAVISSGLTSADGGPNGTALEYLLPDLFKADVGEAFRPSRPQLKSAKSRHVDSADAHEIHRAMVENGEWLAAVCTWYDLCRAANRRASLGVSAEKLLTPAKQLSESHPDPSRLSEAMRFELAESQLTMGLSRQRGLTASAVSTKLSLNYAEYSAMLDDAWHRESPPPDTTPTFSGGPSGDLSLAFAAACGFQEAVPTASPEAVELWKEWVASPQPTDRLSRELSRDGIPQRPQLVGPVNRPKGSAEADFIVPLDLAINARLSRSLRDPTSEGAPSLGADEAINAAIRWSALPLGLPTGWPHAVLNLGFELTGHVFGDSLLLEPDSPSPPRGYEGGALTMAAAWRRSGLSALNRGARLDDPLLASAHRRYLSRLWIRIFRQALNSESEPSATEVWAHVYGAFKSIVEQTKRLGLDVETGGPKGILPERPPETEADHDPTSAIVQELLYRQSHHWSQVQMDEAEALLDDMGPFRHRFESEVLSLGSLRRLNAAQSALHEELKTQWRKRVVARNHDVEALFLSQGRANPYPDLDVPFDIALELIRSRASKGDGVL